MLYYSTRNKNNRVTASKAILTGISQEGGLFVPERIPQLSKNDIDALRSINYKGRAKYILKMYLSDFTDEEISYCVEGAYTGTFDNENPAKLVNISDNKNILELWHGPTCAFKDLALQILPYLMTVSAKKQGDNEKIIILVATSGDTGKAALEGFKDVKGTGIIVFYPNGGVSATQRLQMVSQNGDNVNVCAIDGNFDDAQTAVKSIFTNKDIKNELKKHNMAFSSANSINWGRLLPQIVYYVSAYCDLLNNNENLSDGFNICVPTGNFGNILAAYYAEQMGIPVNKLICASNINNVLTDFINTGIYNKNRPFTLTTSPSMDILVSSNLERLIFAMYNNCDNTVSSLQESLKKNGVYSVSDEVRNKINKLFYGNFCDDTATATTIKETYEKYNYLMDTHTAVAMNVYNKYVNETADKRPTVIASTASPYKFSAAVLSALGENTNSDDFINIGVLSNKTRTKIPKSIEALKNAGVRFDKVCSRDNIADYVLRTLGIK